MSRRLIACGFLGMTLLVAACGNKQDTSGGAALSTAPSTSSSTPSASASVPPTKPSTAGVGGTGRCTAATLSGKVDQGDAGAGQRYAKFVVTNTGTAPCTLNGYSGFQLLDGAGKPIPTTTERKPDPAPSLVTLAPGAAAAANLHWSVIAQQGESETGPCQPEAVTAQAIPPDETAPITLPWSMGPVCGGGKIEISAFYAA
jgi:hypothetical protein